MKKSFILIGIIFCMVLTLVCSTKVSVESVEPEKFTDRQEEIIPESELQMYGKTFCQTRKSPNGIFLYEEENGNIPEYVIVAIDNSGITNSMTDFDKCVAFADYLSDLLYYDSQFANSFDGHYDDSMYMLFTDWCLNSNKALCAGYADAFQSMCTAVGIECWYQTGHTLDPNTKEESVYHAWNRVVIDGEDKFFDICYYDSSNCIETTYLGAPRCWNNRVVEKETYRYRINGANYDSNGNRVIE